MRVLAHHRYTWRDYLELEEGSNGKHEFLDGEIFAMAGGTPEHAALDVAVSAQLHGQLQGKPCRVYSSDLRIRVPATGLASYPDVTVLCGKPESDPEAKHTFVNPTLLVEVLSDSTEAYDRGEKFEHYRQLASLQEYVLVSTRERLIETWHRAANDQWTRSEARGAASLALQAIGCTLELRSIYADLGIR
jgi:Uma2 family endonuclease